LNEQNLLKELEEVLGARGRIRLLAALSAVEEINITRLAKICRIQHTSAEKNLQLLLRHGIVVEKRFGKIRIFSLDLSNGVTRSIKRMFEDTTSRQKKSFS
jgi:DNA-binding transcriptional ArsR family regulator